MPLILCLETTTTNCSVSLVRDGELLLLKEDMGLDYSHAERLHRYIRETLQEASVSQNALDAVVVSKGPGSYTGLRIGVSAAKGLCFGLDLPLLATDTLQSLAMQVKDSKAEYIIPLLDARRMEVYSAVYNSSYEQLREIQAEILQPDSFLDYLEKGKTVFIGNGVAKFKEIVQHPNAVFLPDALPSAREMAGTADLKYKKNDIEDVAYFEPFYLKDFLVTTSKK